jgi:hypothetical protein
MAWIDVDFAARQQGTAAHEKLNCPQLSSSKIEILLCIAIQFESFSDTFMAY